MRKLVHAFAILAAAASTAAVAGELKQDKKATAPAVAATQMTDAEMDRVTAGGGTCPGTGCPILGLGRYTSDTAQGGTGTYKPHNSGNPGYGVCTTSASVFGSPPYHIC